MVLDEKVTDPPRNGEIARHLLHVREIELAAKVLPVVMEIAPGRLAEKMDARRFLRLKVEMANVDLPKDVTAPPVEKNVSLICCGKSKCYEKKSDACEKNSIDTVLPHMAHEGDDLIHHRAMEIVPVLLGKVVTETVLPDHLGADVPMVPLHVMANETVTARDHHLAVVTETVIAPDLLHTVLEMAMVHPREVLVTEMDHLPAKVETVLNAPVVQMQRSEPTLCGASSNLQISPARNTHSTD